MLKAYKHKVQYYETDKMAVVHHSNYIRWFEEARTDLMEQLGFGYARTEAEGIMIPVLEVTCKYRSMVRYGEEVYIIPKVEQFNGIMEGHAGYIEYFYTNLRLPNFDPREIFQFYHPPLHHILAAIWMKINIAFGISFEQAGENIQILTMFYSGIFLFFTRKIFHEFGLERAKLVLAYTFVAFYPALIIMSGSINNDMLSITLMQGAIYYAIRWYKGSHIGSIIGAALFMGFGMMTKLSVGTSSIAIAFLFLLKLVNEPEKRKRMMVQILVFGFICFPLALWWGIRNLILFGVPITYIPSLGLGSHQYVGHYTLFQRLLDFSFYQFRSVYVAWGDPYFEHNIFIGLLKTGTFGEQTLSKPEGFVYIAAQVLFYINVVFAVLVTVAGPFVMFGKKVFKDRDMRAFSNILFITFLLAYVQFCLAYAHTCTQNLRYATPLIWIGALVVASVAGGSTKQISGQSTKSFLFSRISFYSIATATLVFAGASMVFFVALLTGNS